MIPCVHNTASNMLAFGSCLLDACCLSNVDRKLALGPVFSIPLAYGVDNSSIARSQAGSSSKVTNLV